MAIVGSGRIFTASLRHFGGVRYDPFPKALL